MTDTDPLPTLRAGRYAIIGVLGAGSQAETLDAVDKRDGRAVAIKRFQVRGAKSWKDVELAEREARVLGSLSHPNLPVYIEHFEEDGALYLVMEKIEGTTLASLRRQKTIFSAPEIVRFLQDAERVLGYLHSRSPPIIHRDLKPGNVIRRADGSFAFVDFGSVRDQLKPEGGSTVVGTFGYMAPEQFQGRALPGSDVYAVAATTLSLVTGREPEDLPHRGLGIDVRAALGPGAERWLVRALSAMLEPDPDRRASRVVLPNVGPSPSSSPGSDESPNRRRARADAWDFPDFRERAKEEGARMKAETRRLRHELKQQLRDETRRVRRAARHFEHWGPDRWARRSRGFGPGNALLVSLLVSLSVLGLLVARAGTFALFRVFLPTLLLALSLLFGRPLRRAAYRCREIGINGDLGLRHALDLVRRRLVEPSDYAGEEEPSEPSARETEVREPRIRVSNPDRIRVREGPSPDSGDPEADSERARRGRL